MTNRELGGWIKKELDMSDIRSQNIRAFRSTVHLAPQQNRLLYERGFRAALFKLKQKLKRDDAKSR